MTCSSSQLVTLCVCVQSCVSSCGKRQPSDFQSLSVVSVKITCHSESMQCARMCSVCRTGSLPNRRWSLERGDRKSAAEVRRKPSSRTSCDALKTRTSRLNKDLTVALNSQKTQVVNWISHNPGLSLVFICVAHILGV